MALLDEILAWTQKELKPWQSDAVRRLFQKVTLEDKDFEELLSLLKSSHGLEVDGAPQPIPLAREHLPSANAGAAPVVLQSLHSLRDVNKLQTGQRLDFSPGLTVVFGENGAGKSGYSRVIKSACRARVKDEAVLPDARRPANEVGVPQAKFGISVDGKPEEVAWRFGEPAPDVLSAVAILDTRCARAYTDQEGELIFAPWGLDVVESLARTVFPRLQQAIEHELGAASATAAAFADLTAQDTSVAKFLRSLTAATTEKEVGEAAAFGEGEAERLHRLETALAERSPTERAQELRELSVRIGTIAETLERLAAPLHDEGLAALRQLDMDLVNAIAAETLAAERLRGNDGLIQGTGEAAWRTLYVAAQDFIEKAGHVHEQGTSCALCQSPLSEAAAARLQRFSEFVADNASRRAAQLRELHQSAVGRLEVLATRADLDETTVEYIRKHVPEWAETTAAHERELAARKTWSLAVATKSHDWSAPPAIVHRPADDARRVQAFVNEQVEALQKAAGPSREAMNAEVLELRARQALSQRIEALHAYHKGKKTQAALSKCLQELRTKPISDKAGALASSAVTAQLSDALNEEFSKLGVRHLHTSLKARNDKGKTKLKLALDLPGAKSPELVLSEGEQRVIAISAFFAELRVSNHRGAAIFDDPVSSLDHWRRQSVAGRLVDEARSRQVVVFTHDTIFLAELIEAIGRSEVDHCYWHLTYSQNEAGRVNAGLPWHHQKTGDRIDKLEKEVRAFAKAEAQLDNVELERQVRWFYAKLREVIERGVEEVVFSAVLQRYNDYVRVPNITNTVGLTEEECKPIVELYERASDLLEGHDKAAARGLATPTSADIAQDLETLKQALAAIRDRRKLKK